MDQKLAQQSTEEESLMSETQKLKSLSQEMSIVKDKLAKQVKMTEEKDKELNQDESKIKEMSHTNMKLNQNLQERKIEIHEKTLEVDQKEMEIKDMNHQLSVSQIENKKIKQDIMKLQEE